MDPWLRPRFPGPAQDYRFVLHPPQYQPYPGRHAAPIGKRRKIELTKDDKQFLRRMESRMNVRKKDSPKITVGKALSQLGEVHRILGKCKNNFTDVDVARKIGESAAVIAAVCTHDNRKALRRLIVQRRRRKAASSAKEQRSAKISALALEIDHWRATMLAQDKKQKEDEELRSTAGNTLKQVLQKQRQTKRLLETVKLLVDLREIRKQQALRRSGTFLEPSVDQRFTRNVDKMKTIIKEKLETFYAEEKTIKVLTEANEADIWGVEKKLRQLEQLPDNMIDYSSVFLEIQYNPRKLVKIRREWDEYLVTPGVPGGSRVPTTPLSPPDHPSPAWTCFLRSGPEVDPDHAGQSGQSGQCEAGQSGV